MKNKKAQNTRRGKSLQRLEKQLKSGSKVVHDSHTQQSRLQPFSEADKKRIEKEIETLKSKITI